MHSVKNTAASSARSSCAGWRSASPAAMATTPSAAALAPAILAAASTPGSMCMLSLLGRRSWQSRTAWAL